MSMPGFAAEASLRTRGNHYVTRHRAQWSAGDVVPQFDDLAASSTSCWRICQCCKRGNRFCCSHCRWCSGPIGPYVSTQY